MHYMSVSARRRYWTYVLLALGVTGCSLHDPPRVVSISAPPAFRPRGPQQVKTLAEALAAIVTVCTADLDLPPVEPLYIHLYNDAASYSFYTGRFSGITENKTPRLTFALPHENQLHVNLESVRGQSWGALLRIIAHEYGHNIEFVITAGETIPRWISEGFAEWVAARVTDGLGWESYSSSLSRAERELSRSENRPPQLSQLEDDSAWTKISSQPRGRVATYDLAFIAVHKLIENRGPSALIDYFTSRDFLAAFGTSPQAFERTMESEFDAIQRAAAAPPSGSQAQKPQWKTGYHWRYALRAPGFKSAIVANDVVREDLFEGTPVFVLAAGKNEYPHDKDRLSVLATLSGGKTINKNDPPSLPLDWPLKVGIRWENDYVVEDLEHKESEQIETEVVVADLEMVRVPAGTFPAFRIETYALPGGELISDQWYAPAVKWFVKSKFYREDGVIEQDLVTFKAD
jgi:hypothetical protein